MSEAVRSWLSEREGAVPPSLLARMEAAVDDVAAERHTHVAETLGAAAMLCLQRALPQCDDRAAALDLLAADALITGACDAAVGDDAAFAALCAAYAPARLAPLLDGAPA